MQNLDTSGQVIVNRLPQEARWSDIFQGEETGNGAHLDLAKVQMLLFTLLVLFAYVVALTRVFGNPETTVSALPVLSDSMVALLGISNAGYLASKAVPYSRRSG